MKPLTYWNGKHFIPPKNRSLLLPRKFFLKNRHRKGEGGGGWDVGVPGILQPKTRYVGVRSRSFFLLHHFFFWLADRAGGGGGGSKLRQFS